MCFRLVVCSNNIATEGLCAFAKAMKTNSTLTNIYIWGNKLFEPACNVSMFNNRFANITKVM